MRHGGRKARASMTAPPRLAALLALAALACPSPRVHPRAAEEVARGYRYLAADDLERADVAFAHALAFNEDIPEAQNGAGIVLRRRGDLDGASRRFEHAVKVAPDFAEGLVNLGEVALTRGREGEAEEDFRAALRVDPDLAVARLDLARTLLHLGRRDAARRREAWLAARREYLHLLEANAAIPEAHHDLGYMDYESENPARAAQEYHRAVELAPDYVEALHGECVALVRLGRCAEAARSCRRCLEVDAGAERCATSLRGALACADEAK
jgi:Tfp pilus assembly protein PilF